MKNYIGGLGVGAALAAMSMAVAAHPADDVIDSRPKPRQRRRGPVAASAKTPKTPADFARLEAAKRKRQRKAERLRALVVRGGFADAPSGVTAGPR